MSRQMWSLKLWDFSLAKANILDPIFFMPKATAPASFMHRSVIKVCYQIKAEACVIQETNHMNGEEQKRKESRDVNVEINFLTLPVTVLFTDSTATRTVPRQVLSDNN